MNDDKIKLLKKKVCECCNQVFWDVAQNNVVSYKAYNKSQMISLTRQRYCSLKCVNQAKKNKGDRNVAEKIEILSKKYCFCGNNVLTEMEKKPKFLSSIRHTPLEVIMSKKYCSVRCAMVEYRENLELKKNNFDMIVLNISVIRDYIKRGIATIFDVNDLERLTRELKQDNEYIQYLR